MGGVRHPFLNHLPFSYLALRKPSFLARGKLKRSSSLDNVPENGVAQVVEKSTWLSQNLTGQVFTAYTIVS